MSDLEIASNEITNYSDKIYSAAEVTLSDHCKQTENIFCQSVSGKIELEQNKTVNKIQQIQKKYSNSKQPKSVRDALINAEVSGLIDDEINLVFSVAASAKNNASASIWAFAKKLFESVKNAISVFADAVKAAFNFVGAALSAIANLVTNLITNIINKLTAIVVGAINLVFSVIDNILAAGIGLLKSFNKLINQPAAFADSKIKKLKKLTNNFYARAEGLSSVSKYIQTNVPTTKGGVKFNPKALLDTPDSKIIIPKLKTELNSVKNVKFNELIPKLQIPDVKELISSGIEAGKAAASLTSAAISALQTTPIPSLSSIGPLITGKIVPSLVPKKVEKKIEEPKPTSKDAAYGQIVVEENAGGHVKIKDETPGNVREINIHPSGTYDQKLDNGDTTNKVTGKQIIIVDKDWELTIGENQIIIVSGDQKIEVRKNKIEDIAENSSLYVGKEKTCIVEKDVADDFRQNYSQKIELDKSVDVGNDMSMIVGNDYDTEIKNNASETIGGNLTIHCSKEVNIIAGGNANLVASGVVRIKGKKVRIG